MPPQPVRAAAPAAPLVLGAAAAQARAQTLARPAPMPMPMPAPEALTRPLGAPRTPPARPPRPTLLATTAPRPAPPRTSWVKDFAQHLNVIQVICWQVAALAVVLTVNQPWPVLAGASTGAALLIALTTVRIGGRWLYQLAVLACGYLTRGRRRDLPETSGKTPALLGLLVPGTTVLATETSQGPAMTVSHHGGLAALLRPTGVPGDLIGLLPLPAALLPVGGDGTAGQPHLFGVQTVFHTGVRRDGPPKVWLGVHAVRTVDSPRDDELALALRNAMRRVRRAAARAGVPAEPLAEEAGFAAVAGLAHVTGGRTEVREDWRFWRTGPVCQAVFAVDGFDTLADSQARRLVGNLFGVTGGVAVTVTLGARTGRTGTRVAAVLRLAATTEAAVEAALAAVTARAVPPGVRLARLDGTHSSGVAASLPIGVFL
jgi:hypothetical protein